MKQKTERKQKSNAMTWIAFGCLLSAIGVASGAIAAHLLEKTLSPEDLVRWATGARYQMYAAFGIIAAGLCNLSSRRRNIVNVTMTVGTILFSGGLYAYTLSGVKVFVAIVPFGGFSMIAAWLMLAWFQFQFRSTDQECGEEV